MSASRILKWVSGGLEALLGIPVLGGMIVMGGGYAPLAIMLVIHIVTLVLTNNDKGDKVGSILGVVTSCLAWIPFVGMVLHILSAIFLMIGASKTDEASVKQI